MMKLTTAVLLLSMVVGTSLARTVEMQVETFRFARQTPCLTDAQRAEILRVVGERREERREGGGNDLGPAQHVLFEWPLRAAAHLNDPGYHGISGFVDHNPSYPDYLSDYNCGTRTYDLESGYNHLGTDFFLWPFIWNKMDNDDVEIVAAAAGEIVMRRDGYYDRNCGFGNPDWNGVVILHSDGSGAVYGHMKSGSVTPKAVGEYVASGEYLGVVGSSGSSTGPHLHFEVWDHNGAPIDPWDGPCNWLNPGESWWIDQRPYYDSALNKISTHSAPVEWGDCPNPDVTYFADSFLPGSLVWLYAFGRDLLMDDRFDFYIYRPDGSTYDTRSFTFDVDPYWPAFALADTVTIPSSEPEGMWKYEAVYKGVSYEHFFEISQWSAVLFESVSAEMNGDRVEIAWDVYTDEPLAGFEVYRSTGTSDEIPVSGNSPLAPNVRSFLDETVRPGVIYCYTVTAVELDGTRVRSRKVSATVEPITMSLSRNFPNPFNPSTTIEYSLAAPAFVRLAVYDARGGLVAILEGGARPAGTHTVHWNGQNVHGDRVGSGTYFYRLQVGKKVLTGKMVLLK